MDSLKSLLDNKQYELVLKLTETSQSSNDLFYRISAFIFLGKYEDALYAKNHNISLFKPPLYQICNYASYEKIAAYSYWTKQFPVFIHTDIQYSARFIK